MIGVDWQQLSYIGGTAVGMVTLAGALAWLWRKIVPTTALSNRLDAVGEHLREQDDHLRNQDNEQAKLGESIKRIEHEVFPNSGNSMRDQINQLTKDSAEMRGILATLRDIEIAKQVKGN